VAAKAQGSFNISIGVVDHATAGLRKVNAQLAALQKPYKDLARAATRFADLTGITKVASGIKRLGSFALDTTEHLAKAGLEVAGIAGIASIGGIIAITTKFGEWGNAVRKTSDWLGTTIAQTISMAQMSRLLGAAPNAMAQSYEHLSDMQRRARLGLDPVTLKNFRTLHISLTDTEQGMQQIFDIGRKLRANGDFAGMRALFEMFGISADLVKEISTGSDTLAEFKKKAEESAKSLAPLAADADSFHTSISLLGVTLDGVLGRALTPFVHTWTDWLSDTKNQDWLVTKIQGWMTAIETFCTHIKEALPKAWDDFTKGKGPIHDIQLGLEVLAGITLVSWAAGIVTSLLSIGAAVGTMPWLLPLLGLAATTVGLPPLLKTAADILDPENKHTGKQNRGGWGGLSWNDFNPFKWTDYNPKRAGAQTSRDSQLVFDTEKNAGRNNWQALAMLANYRRESSLDPYSTSDQGEHLGIGQWDSGRQAEFTKVYGHAMNSMMFTRATLLRQQAEFGNYELTHGQSKYAERFLAANDSSAVGTYTADLERSLNQGADIRKSNALAQDSMSRLHLTVEHVNPPPGSSVGIAASGPLFPGPPPQVVTTMPFGSGAY
jgi:hypothetical protein